MTSFISPPLTLISCVMRWLRPQSFPFPAICFASSCLFHFFLLCSSRNLPRPLATFSQLSNPPLHLIAFCPLYGTVFELISASQAPTRLPSIMPVHLMLQGTLANVAEVWPALRDLECNEGPLSPTRSSATPSSPRSARGIACRPPVPPLLPL